MATTWSAIEGEIKRDLELIYRYIQSLAPQNSRYVSIDRGRVVDYIYVDGKRTRTNTNNLFNSVSIGERSSGNGKDLVSIVYVDGGRVPYYQRAVLSPTLRVAKHFGRTEYGRKRYGSESVEKDVVNRNYLYYMKAEGYVASIIGKYNGREYRITDSIEVFK